MSRRYEYGKRPRATTTVLSMPVSRRCECATAMSIGPKPIRIPCSNVADHGIGAQVYNYEAAKPRRRATRCGLRSSIDTIISIKRRKTQTTVDG